MFAPILEPSAGEPLCLFSGIRFIPRALLIRPVAGDELAILWVISYRGGEELVSALPT